MEDNKPHIAIIVPGGIGTGTDNIGVPVLEQIVQRLAIDFNITVFSLFKVNDDYRSNGFQIKSIQSNFSVVKFFKVLSEVRRVHRVTPFSAIHGFWTLPSGFVAVIIGKLLNIKSIVSVLGGDGVSVPSINYGELRRPLTRKIIHWALTNADHSNVLTKFLADSLAANGLKRKLTIVPWGIDTNLFKFRNRILSDKREFLHIANFSAVKDQITLLKAFKLIAEKCDARLTIVGKGKLEESLKDLVEKLSLTTRVNFVKPVKYVELPAFYQRSDVLLHTSLSEGQSEVVTEAMSSGVVVCGTSVGLMYDLKDKCCVAVDVADHEALSEQVLTLLADGSRFEKLKLSARRWAEDYSIGWTVTQYSILYRS